MADHFPKPKSPWDSLAEQRIREAQACGKFDNLPGFGKPIPGIDAPYDELWWVKDKLRREEISCLPPALALKLDVQRTLEKLADQTAEWDVRRELEALNERIRKLSSGPLWGPSVDFAPMDIDEVVDCWRSRRANAT